MINKRQERYNRIKSNGKCPSHPNEPIVLGKSCCQKCLDNSLKYRKKHIIHTMWMCAKRRSLKNNISFNITEQDIIDIIPKDNKCPIFNREFESKTRWAMTIDKIIPDMGYIKENIQIVSLKANVMKQNTSQKQQLMFAQWIKREDEKN